MASLSQTRWTEAASPAPGSMFLNKNFCRLITPYVSAPIFGLHRRLPGTEISGSELHKLAAEETVRALYDQPLQSRIVQLPLENGLNGDNQCDVDCCWRVILPAGFHDHFSFFKECADCLSNEALRKDGIARLERVNDALVLLKASDPLLVLSPRSLNTHHYKRE